MTDGDGKSTSYGRRGILLLSTTLPFLFPLREYVKDFEVQEVEWVELSCVFCLLACTLRRLHSICLLPYIGMKSEFYKWNVSDVISSLTFRACFSHDSGVIRRMPYFFFLASLCDFCSCLTRHCSLAMHFMLNCTLCLCLLYNLLSDSFELPFVLRCFLGIWRGDEKRSFCGLPWPPSLIVISKFAQLGIL